LTQRCVLALILVPVLASCASHHALASSGAAVVAANGPGADYPIVIGDPYKVGVKLYTPADTMNYDEVGFVAADNGSGVTGSNHTLPLPSYVEVTSLDTGRTILVRLERRGPMSGDAIVALSPQALAQLGATDGSPVRVRRVNPPEEERAVLRAGRSAPPRMDTPASLVAVLKRKLPGQGSVALAAAKPAALPATIASVELPPSTAVPHPALQPPVTAPAAIARRKISPPALPPLPSRTSEVAAARLVQAPSPPAPADATARVAVPKPAPRVAQHGAFVVQAASMSTSDRAQKVAGAIGGSISKAGQYYRVQTGPFGTREQAEASLAKVRAAGYSDARIFTNG
jgi:rare lipoprotein A